MAGDVLVVEHKTSGEDISPGSDYIKRLKFDPQVSLYFDGARALGHEPSRCLYDILGKPRLRPFKAGAKRAKDETPEEYRDRCIEEIGADPNRYFQRSDVVRLESEMDEARFDVWNVAAQIRESELAKRYPRNPQSCLKYGRPCEFLPVCCGEAELDNPHLYRRDTSFHAELASAKDDREVLTNSRMGSFRACSRLHHYRYDLGYRPLETPESLAFGTLVHAALEAWWKAQHGSRLQEALDALRASEADPFDRARAEAMLIGYDQRWGDHEYEVIAVEAEFSMPLINPATGRPSPLWKVGGKIDALVRERS